MVEKCFEYDYLQSHVVIVYFQTETFFTATRLTYMYKKWQVKKNYGHTLCTGTFDTDTVVSCTSCFVVVYVQTEARFSKLLNVSYVHVCLYY